MTKLQAAPRPRADTISSHLPASNRWNNGRAAGGGPERHTPGGDRMARNASSSFKAWIGTEVQLGPRLGPQKR